MASSYPAVSRVDETEGVKRIIEAGERKRAGVLEDAAVYGPGGCIIGEDILSREHAVFTEDTSEYNVYSACTITPYKNDTDARRIGTSQFQYHGLISLCKGQYLVIMGGYAVEADRVGITPGTTGMYKVGQDTEPETYRITPLTSGNGYYALYNDVRYYYDYINEYAVLFEPVTANIASGQYPELPDAEPIERVLG